MVNSDPNCIFCQIVAKKKPEEILYEDDRVICFLDRFRQSSVGGHALVIPREHYENIWSLPNDLCAPLMQVTHLIAKASKEAIPCSGIRLWIANGKSAGQEIFHLHVHVFPCTSVMDRIKYVFPSLTGKQAVADSDLSTMAEPIRQKIMEISKIENRPIAQ
ncbi:MAG: HIT domain-containing protein [Gemmatimonadetes bacterium]|nr:HIT domain-containing protein [Gemmatimonadota bacterium]